MDSKDLNPNASMPSKPGPVRTPNQELLHTHTRIVERDEDRPNMILGTSSQSKSAADAIRAAQKAGEPTVTMVFPKRVLLQYRLGQLVEFLPGIQEVPLSMADHQYLEANGVHKYTPPKPPEPPVMIPTGAPVEAEGEDAGDQDYTETDEDETPSPEGEQAVTRPNAPPKKKKGK